MDKKQYYGNLIWTNHALERLDSRGLTQNAALQTFQSPDRFFAGKEKGSTEYIKKFGATTVTLIAKQNEKREWIVISVWANPPFPGTPDHKKRQSYLQYKNARGWKKFFLTFLRQLGL